MGGRFSDFDAPATEYTTDNASCSTNPRSVGSKRIPLTLRRPWVLAFNAILICLCIGIGLLWRFAQRLGGYHLDGANPYLLKYGPTTVFVLLIGAWRQLDYHTKSALPWYELARGSSRASRSLLLDYVSIFQAAAVWKALRNKHWTVVLSVLGFVSLKTSTLVSTGLLVVDSSVLSLYGDGSAETALNSNMLWDNATLASADQSIVYTAYGILDQKMQKPLGLGDGLAISTFSPPLGITSDANITAELDAFLPSLHCQQANISATLPSPNDTDSFPDTMLQLSLPGCVLRLQDVSVFTLNPRIFKCPERQLSGLIRSIDCDSSVFNMSGGAYKLIAVADMRYSQELNDLQADAELSTPVQASKWDTEIANLVGVVCRLSYVMQPVIAKAQANRIAESISYGITNATESYKLPNFSDEYLGKFIDSALTASDEILGSRTLNRYALEYPDPMLKLMALTVGSEYENLLDTSRMAQAAESVTLQLAAQVAHKYLRVNSSTRLPLQVDLLDTRLKVATAPAWIIIGLLLFVTAINTMLAVSRHTMKSSIPPEDLVSFANLLNDNAALVPDLIESQAYTEKELHKTLERINVRHKVTILEQDQIRLESPIKSRKNENWSQPWWSPITVSKPALVFTFCSAAAAVAVLEVLQRLSDTRDGFVQLPTNASESDIVYVHFLPAIVVLLLASMFNCLDFNIILATPFHEMRFGMPIREIRTRSLLSRIPVFALWVSIRGFSRAAIASSLAAFVGSLMTIVVSGLYTIEALAVGQSVQLLPTDNFVVFWTGSAINDSGAALISSLTENLEFPDPRGTFNEVAFPYLRFAQDPESNTTLTVSSPATRTFSLERDTSFTAKVPSLRGDLECTSLSSLNFSVDVSRSKILTSISVNATYELPAECSFGGADGIESILNFIETFPLSDTANSTYIGKLLDLHVGPYDSIKGDSQGERDPSAMKDNPLGCPSLAFIYGFVDLDGAASGLSEPRGLSVDVCYQRLQALKVEVDFMDSSFTVNASNPPRVDESTLQYLAADTNVTSYVQDIKTSTAYQFRLQGHFEQSFVAFNMTNNNPFSTHDASTQVVDSFFQGVLFGRAPLPLTVLKIENDDQKALVQKGILAFYRRYMAQAISLNMRVSTDKLDNSTGQAEEGSIVTNVHTVMLVRRVVQKRTSKLILQCMLCFMLACGIIAVSTIKLHNLLPACANPCTIWGRLSLWAGSRFCEADPKNFGRKIFDDDRDLAQGSQLFEAGTETLKLGWWTMSDGRERYGIDVCE